MRVVLVLVSLLAILWGPRSAFAQGDALCFDVPTIRACIEGRFRQYWEQNGGLAVFGYPITPAFIPPGEGMFLTQYFERSRFEYHADKPAPYDVSLGRLGNEQLDLMGLNWHDFGRAFPGDAHFFEATGHAIAHEPFARYWLEHGLKDPALDGFARSLALFGMPLSEPMPIPNDRGEIVLTQWFERARFEDHGSKGVLLGRLGDETKPSGPFEPPPVPAPLPEPTPLPEPAPLPEPTLPPPTGDKVVYLTFDDGPFPLWTEQVLDILARYNARATFFVIGRQVHGKDDLLRRAATQGSTFANHTYNHTSVAGISREQFRDEVLATEQSLGPYATKCFRPPYGAVDANTYAFAQELGYRLVMWDLDPYDWQNPGVGAVVSRVVGGVRPGSIVLMHDGGGNRAQSVAALDTILATLTGQGYRFDVLCH